MSDPKRKTRMISFRISEQEYEALRTGSAHEGAASVSDYARTIVQRLTSGGIDFPEHPLHAQLRQIDGNVQEVNRGLQRLMQMIEDKRED